VVLAWRSGVSPRMWPFGLAALGLGAWGLSGEMSWGLPALAGLGLTWAAWLWSRGLGAAAGAYLLLLVPLGFHFGWQLPQTLALLPSPGGGVRVEGVVRGQQRVAGGVRYLLGQARLSRLAESPQASPAISSQHSFSQPSFSITPSNPPSQTLAEVEVEITLGDSSRKSVPWWAVGREVMAAGRLAHTGWHQGRLVVTLAEGDMYAPEPPLWAAERWRLELRDRAAYYLDREALAVYLPTMLGLRETDSPEARRVAQDFRLAGVSHLFAISGLNMALLYGLFLAAGRLAQGLGGAWGGQRGGWGLNPARAGALVLLWGYLALIGFMPPAARAVVMVTLVSGAAMAGVRPAGPAVVALAAGAMLLPDPTLAYDLSFQLSFLAYYFVLAALAAARGLVPRGPWLAWGWAWRAVALNLWVTGVVTLGLWPLSAAVFGQVSLLVFLGNLVLVPPMELVMLPVGLAAMGASLPLLGQPPGWFWEAWAYALVEQGYRFWARAAAWVAHLYDGQVPVHLDWSSRGWVLYYALLLVGLAWLARKPKHS